MPLKAVNPRTEAEYWRDAYGEDPTAPPQVATPTDIAEPQNEMGNFSRGLNAGVNQTQALGGGLKAAFGSVIGSEATVDSGMEIYRRNMSEADEYAGDVMTVEEIDSVSEAGQWAAYTLGTLVPDLAGAITTGGVGGVIAKQAVKKGVKELAEKTAQESVEELLKAGVEKDAAEYVSKEIAEKKALDYSGKVATMGALAGTGTYTAPTITGGSFANILEETGVEAPLTALGVGVVGAGLEAAPFMKAFTSVFPSGSLKKFKEFVAGDIADSPKWVTQALKDIVQVQGAEGGTEALQFLLEESAVTFVNNNYTNDEAKEYLDFLSNERKRSGLINSTAAGLLMGTATGVGTAGIKTAKGQYKSEQSQQAKDFRTENINNENLRSEVVSVFERYADADAKGEQALPQPTQADTDALNANEPLTPEQRQEAGLSELADIDVQESVQPVVEETPVADPEPAVQTEIPQESAPQADIVTDFPSAPAFGERPVPEGSQKSGDLYEYHQFEGALSDPAKPVQDQLVELSVAAKTPEALDPNNTDVVVEAIDVDDVDRIFDRNDFVNVETADKPKGKSLPTIDEAYGDNAKQVTDTVAGVMADLSSSGVPKSFIDAVSGIYVHKESEVDSPAFTGNKSLGVSINADLISGAINDPSQLSEMAWSLTHEVYHAADFSMGLSDKDSQFGMQIVTERDQPTVVMGDVMDEIFTNWENRTELGKRFNYPFNDLQKEILDLDKDNEGLDVKYRQEVFAQLGAMFHSNPKLLQEQSPLAYNYIKDIRDRNLQTANVPEVQSEGTNSPIDPNPTEPTGLRGQVRAPPESRGVESAPITDTGSDGEGSVGEGRTDPAVEGQAQEEVGQRERSDLQKPEVAPAEDNRTEVVLKATDKKPTFKKAENYEDTGNYIVTFADGDRYTLYFDDDAKDGGDEVYFTSEDGKVTGLLGETKEETITQLQEHRQKLIEAGKNSFNTPLDPIVSSDTSFKAYNLITDHPEGKLELTKVRKKFKKLEDNQFDQMIADLIEKEGFSLEDGVLSDPEAVEERLAEERYLAEEAEFDRIAEEESSQAEEEARLDEEVSQLDIEDDLSFIKRENLSPTAQEITASAILYGDESMDIVATGRNGSAVVVDLARAFDERVKKANDGEIFSNQDEATLETISDLIAHEAVEAMRTDGNAGEWYQEKVANAMRIASETFPELSTDPNAKFAFTAIMAVTSNGASVPENSINTFEIYQKYRETKIFPNFGVGKESQAMEKSFSLLNRLIKSQGVDSVRKFMDMDVTVKELINDFGLTVSGELMGTKLKGSAILGPKIGGGFYQNLNGNFDPLTMDRWFMRTYGRLTGTLMAEADRKLPAQVDKFREVALGDDFRKKLKEDGISRVQLKKDDQYLVAYATKVQASYANGGFKLKSAINKASNNLKNSQGEKQAPQNGKEREFIREVMIRALTKVNETSGLNSVNMGALQAIVWYPEKNLYKMLGVGNKKSEPTDYETEFKKITEARGQRGQDLSGSIGSAQQSGAGRLESADGADVSNTNPANSRQNRQEDSQSEIDAPPEEISLIKGKTLADGSPSTFQFSARDDLDSRKDLKSRFKKSRNSTVRKLADRYDDQKDFEDQAAEYLDVGRLPANLSPRDQENLSHGRVQEDIKAFHKNYVDPIGELIQSSQIDPESIGLYLLAKHAPERNADIADKERTRRDANIAREEKTIEKLLADTDVDHTVALETARLSLENYKSTPLMFEDTGSGMTNAEAQSVLNTAEREGTKDAMEEIASKVYEMLQYQRDRMVEAGLLDEVSKGSWEAKFKFYVPLKGFAAEDNGSKISEGTKSKGFSIVGSESMKAKGRSTLPVNPLLTAIEDVQRKIIRARKNETAQTLLDLLGELGNSSVETQMESGPVITKAYTIYNNKFRPPVRGDEFQDNPRMMDVESMSGATRTTNGEPRYVSVKKGGQTFWIEFHSDTLNHSLQNMSVPMLDRGNDDISKVLNFLTRFQNFRRNMLINYNPAWGLVNPIRDIATGLMYGLSEMDKKGSRTSGKNPMKGMAKTYVPAMRSLWRHYREKPVREGNALDQYTKEFHDDGASTGLMLMKDTDEQLRELNRQLKKGTPRKALRAIGKLVEDFNTTAENAARLSAYVEARKLGAPREDAATLAKDLTVNFNRKGEDTGFVNALYLFFNAAVQGNVNIMQALSSRNSDKTITSAQVVAGAMVMVSYFISMANIGTAEEDDDGRSKYEDIPEHAKNRALLFMYGQDEGLAVPAPYGYNFFTNIGRFIAEIQSGVATVEDTAWHLIDNIFLNFVPIAPSAGDNLLEKSRGFAPDVFEVILDLMVNKDYFGSEIAVEQNPLFVERSPSSLAKRNTDQIFKDTTRFLNEATGGDEFEKGHIALSPDRMQYIFNYLTGGLGRFGTQSLDAAGKVKSGEKVPNRKKPIIGTFFKETSPYIDRFKYYDNYEDVRKIEARFKEALPEDIPALLKKYKPFFELQQGETLPLLSVFVRDSKGDVTLLNRSNLYKQANRTMGDLSKMRKRLEKLNSIGVLKKDEQYKAKLKEIEDGEALLFDLFNKAYRKAEKKANN